MTDDGPHPVALEDCSSYSYFQRYRGYIENYGGKDAKRWTNETLDLARDATIEEMMNEQHVMLMAICDTLGIKGGWQNDV